VSGGSSDPHDDENPRICWCWYVDHDRVMAAIRAGATTVEEIGEATRAGTGCGTCRWDLEDLLRRAAAEASTERSEP